MCQLCEDAFDMDEMPLSTIEMLADDNYDFEDDELCEECDNVYEDPDYDDIAEDDVLQDCLDEATSNEEMEDCYEAEEEDD